ncbi:MAG: phospho-N-acetylmuramoyl-pentapeptide-transferase, partial [Desulfobulbales bacterium]
MLYHFLYSLHTQLSALNVFRYITFRTIGSTITAFLILFVLGPRFIRMLQKMQIGQVIRDDGPETHMSKQGVPTMGGVLI